jgi:hypothetical protein
MENGSELFFGIIKNELVKIFFNIWVSYEK